MLVMTLDNHLPELETFPFVSPPLPPYPSSAGTKTPAFKLAQS